MIDIQRHLNNLSRLDFTDESSSPMEQLGEGLREIFAEFPLDGLYLWVLDNEHKKLECYLRESRDPHDLLDQHPDGRLPVIDVAEIVDFFSSLLATEKAILSSDLKGQAFQQLSERRPQHLQDKEVLLLPIHSVRGIEGIVTARPIAPFNEWLDAQFSAFLHNILCFSNAYLSLCHSHLIKALESKNQLLNEIEQMAHIGGWEYSVDDGALYWTDETYRIYGLAPDGPVTPEQGISFYPDDSQQQIRAAFQEALAHGKSYEKELQFVDNYGNPKWVRTTGRVHYNNNKIARVYGAFEDITREKQLIDYEKNATAYFEGVLNNLHDAVITVDCDGVINTANQAVKKIFGYSQTEMVGKNISVLMPDPYRAMHSKYMNSYLKTGNAKIIGVGRELPALRKNGEEFSMELSLSEVTQNGQRFFIGIVRDLTERKEAEGKLFHMAFFDELTGLPNRASFERDLNDLLAKAQLTGSEIYASLIDVDRFSQINLTYGKASGDYTLNMISNRINGSIPKGFTLYRNSADTFFLLHNTPVQQDHHGFLKHTREFSQRILQSISDELIINDHSHNMTASIGSGFIHSHEMKPSRLINMLEFACNDAKKKGGNRHITADENTHALIERKALISNCLAHGLGLNEFSLVLQPQYNRDKQIIASEALIRWSSQELGFISPAEFIPIAEETGKIVDIGDWVLNETCRLLHRLKQQNIHTTVAVNISAKQIIQPDFCDKLLVITNKWLTTSDQLVLEITETTLVSDIDLVKERMNYLSNLGFRFSIDDFGTGYSSLSYLRQLPLHELKIDRYFIDEIGLGGADVPIVNSIIQMAKALNVRVVAEGVESDTQLHYLMDKGCDVYQGYHLNKPLAADQWLELLCNSL